MGKKKKSIEILVRSTPTNPKFGYGDQISVLLGDNETLYGGHCSTCPNPFTPTGKVPWEKAYAWIAPGEYEWRYAYNPKFGRCLLIEGGGRVPTRYPNPNKGGQEFATEIFIHAGGIKSNNPQWRGSKGCITIPPADYNRFMDNFKGGDMGVLSVRDFLQNRSETPEVSEAVSTGDPAAQGSAEAEIQSLQAEDFTIPDYHSGIFMGFPERFTIQPNKTTQEEVGGMAKSLLKSKTFWANVLSSVVVLLDKLTGLNVIPTDVAAIVITLINIILRMVTHDPVKIA